MFAKKKYIQWIKNEKKLYAKEYFPSARKTYAFLSQTIFLSPHESTDFTLWRLANEKIRTDIRENNIGFSICMPVYNTKQVYLRKALDSVLAQTYKNWELCIADDKSTDPRVGQILEEYAARDQRIHVIFRNENGNIAQATNTAIDHAHFPWLAFMDADDTLAPDALSLFAEAISQHPEGMLFYSDEDKLSNTNARFFPYFKNARWDPFLLKSQNFVNHLCVLSKERVMALGKLDPDTSGVQDHDLLLRYTQGLLDCACVHIPSICYHWRYNEESVSQIKTNKTLIREKMLHCVQRHLDKYTPGAYAKHSGIYLRIQYPLPNELPLLTCILDCRQYISIDMIKQYLPKILQSILSYNNLEFFMLLDSEYNPDISEYCTYQGQRYNRTQVLYAQADTPITDIIYRNQNRFHGRYIAIPDQNHVPNDKNWLEILISFLYQDSVACVGPKIIYKDITLVNAGYMTDAKRMLVPILFGTSNTQSNWFSWNKLTRTVDAIDINCAVFDAELFFQAEHSDFFAFCSFLRKKSRRTIWCADTIFHTEKEPKRIVIESDLEPLNKNIEHSHANFWNLFTPCSQNR